MPNDKVTLSGTIEEKDGNFFAVLKAGPFPTAKEADLSVAAMFANIAATIKKIEDRVLPANPADEQEKVSEVAVS